MSIHISGCQYHREEKLRAVMVVAIASLKGQWVVDCLSWLYYHSTIRYSVMLSQEPVREFHKWRLWLGYLVSVSNVVLVFIGISRLMGINLHPDCMHRIEQKEGTGFKRMIFTSAFLIWRGILLRSPRLFNDPPTRISVATVRGSIRKVLCMQHT